MKENQYFLMCAYILKLCKQKNKYVFLCFQYFYYLIISYIYC